MLSASPLCKTLPGSAAKPSLWRGTGSRTPFPPPALLGVGSAAGRLLRASCAFWRAAVPGTEPAPRSAPAWATLQPGTGVRGLGCGGWSPQPRSGRWRGRAGTDVPVTGMLRWSRSLPGCGLAPHPRWRGSPMPPDVAQRGSVVVPAWGCSHWAERLLVMLGDEEQEIWGETGVQVKRQSSGAGRGGWGDTEFKHWVASFLRGLSHRPCAHEHPQLPWWCLPACQALQHLFHFVFLLHLGHELICRRKKAVSGQATRPRAPGRGVPEGAGGARRNPFADVTGRLLPGSPRRSSSADWLPNPPRQGLPRFPLAL